MDTVNFLDGEAACLPKTRIGDFPAFLEQILNDYHADLRRVGDDKIIDRVIKEKLTKVAKLSDAVKEVIRLAVAGERDGAYALLDTTLTDLGPHLRALMPRGDMSGLINPLYRFRPTERTAFAKGDIFHIPFQLSHIVKEMRYSIAGLPMLYLGGSTHVCWKEVTGGDMSLLSKMSVSRFNAVQDCGLKILNFGHRPYYMAMYVARTPHAFWGPTPAAIWVAAHVTCWPLVAACSICVPDRTRPERPEYVLPQLVLEWLSETHAYHGIRYFSTHYSEYPDDPKTYMNYVFPPRTILPSGHL